MAMQEAVQQLPADSGGEPAAAESRSQHANDERLAPSAPTPPDTPPEPAPAEPPDDLLCPIGMELLVHAVVTPCGHEFNEGPIRAHLNEQQKHKLPFTCPMCSGRIGEPNLALALRARNAAKAWLEANPRCA